MIVAKRLALISICLIAGCGAWAQRAPQVGLQGFCVGVRPQLIDLTGPAGAQRSFDLFVRNPDRMRSSHVWLWVAEALQSPQGSLDFTSKSGYEYSAAEWLKLDRSELTVLPGKEEKVHVTFTVPGKARGSGHAVVIVSGAPPDDVPIAPTRENQAFAVTRVRFGVIFHYAIRNTGAPGANVEAMYLTQDPPKGSGLTRQTSPFKHWLVARVRNTGNVMIYGYGWALLRRKNIGLVERWRLGQKEYGSRRVIYPGRSVDICLPVSRPLPSGDYSAQMRMDYAPGRAAAAEVPLTVTADDVAGAFASQSGPFATQTIGLALTVENELETVKVAPGGVRTGTIKVSNNEAVPLQVDVEPQDVTMDADGVILPEDSPSPITATGNWLYVGTRSFSLPPGKSRKLPYRVTVPQGAPTADDLVGFLRLRGRQLDAVARQTLGEVIGETGVLMIATQAGRGVPNASLGVLQVDVRPELPNIIRVGVPIKNTGNVHFLPVVTLQLQGVDNPAFTAELVEGNRPPQTLILPGRERLVWFQLPQERFRPGDYRASVSLDYGGTQPCKRGFTIKLHDATQAPPPVPTKPPGAADEKTTNSGPRAVVG